jgi:hypothetical protein
MEYLVKMIDYFEDTQDIVDCSYMVMKNAGSLDLQDFI